MLLSNFKHVFYADPCSSTSKEIFKIHSQPNCVEDLSFSRIHLVKNVSQRIIGKCDAHGVSRIFAVVDEDCVRLMKMVSLTDMQSDQLMKISHYQSEIQVFIDM